MPRIVAELIDDSCLDSAVVKSYELDVPIDVPAMRRLAAGARLQYFPEFPRPYFRIDRSKAYVVQGIVGERSIRVTYSSAASHNAEGELKSLIESDGAP